MAKKENRSDIIVNLAGNISARGAQFARDLVKFTDIGQASMARLKRATTLGANGLDSLGNRYTAVAAAFASTQIVRGVGDIDARMTQLGINASLTDDQLAGVKQRIFEMARLPSIRMDPTDLLTAVEQITSRTGKLDVALDNLENVGELMRATGTDAQSAGDLIADFYDKFDIRKGSDMKAVLSSLALQGKSGAFELKDLAAESAQVSDAFAMTGQKGPQAAIQMGAILQMIRRTTSSSSEASVAFTRMLDTMTTERVKDLEQHGIQVFDPKKLQEGVRIMRPVPDILKDIIKASGGDLVKLSDTFDIKALRAIQAFADDMKKNGDLKDFDKFLGIQDLGSDLTQDAIRNALEYEGAVKTLQATLSKGLNDTFSGPIKAAAKAINSLNPETLDLLLKIIGGGTLLLAGAVAARGAYKVGRGAVQDIRWVFTGKRPGEKEGENPLGAFAGAGQPVPVYIVNGPTLASSIASGTGAQVSSRLGRLGNLAGRAAGVVATGLTVYETAHAFGTWLDTKMQEAKTDIGFRDAVGSGLAHIAAILGSEEATGAVRARVQSGDGQFQGHLKITVDSKGHATAQRVDQDDKRLETSVYSGHPGMNGRNW